METKENKNKSKNEVMINIINIFFAVAFSILYIITYLDYSKGITINTQSIKLILSWIGIIECTYIMITWYIKTGRILDLYTIMILFLVLFNYGQCLLWAFQIHAQNEIGISDAFGIGASTDNEIIVAQLITLMCIFMFHVGSCLCHKSKKAADKNKDYRNSIYTVSKILSFIVIPVTFFELFVELRVSSNYGYSSLYYGDYKTGSILIEMISRLFYPCLFGLLIGSNFNKKIRNIVYSLFLIYMVITLASGDRGAWIYGIFVLFFLHNKYVKKLHKRSIFIIAIISIISLNFINAIVSIRNTGINIENILKALETKNNPIVKNIVEMGGSMKIQTTLVRTGFKIYPYGNTYIFSILGIISDKFIRLLNIEYMDLTTWFSQEYLGLNNWGAGFSIVGEALINYGPYYAPIAMLIIGYIISSLVYLSDEDLNSKSMKVLFAAIGCVSLTPIFRGAMSYYLKVYFYRLVVFMGAIILHYAYCKFRKSEKGNNPYEDNVLYSDYGKRRS